MTKEEINEICLKYKIKNYTINDNLSIDVDGDVDLHSRGLDKLPLVFRNVKGSFNCSWNNLTSLEGAPNYVGHSIYCHDNYLTSLEGAPSSVGDNFDCHNNPLESLKGIPLNLSEYNLYLLNNYTYGDYLAYCNSYKRDLKFKKLLK